MLPASIDVVGAGPSDARGAPLALVVPVVPMAGGGSLGPGSVSGATLSPWRKLTYANAPPPIARRRTATAATNTFRDLIAARVPGGGEEILRGVTAKRRSCSRVAIKSRVAVA
jgi:hypothetical protein